MLNDVVWFFVKCAMNFGVSQKGWPCIFRAREEKKKEVKSC